ncbi:DNA-processing protein DprA [Patescibacteria group bacterium]|nr:DNA-processing protein DprA [Patescibacteria group bacterium]
MLKKIAIEDEDYPELLRIIKDPPEMIFCKGRYTKDIFDRCLGVVGSRRLTPYGKKVIETVISSLVYTDITIVSGFMYGADAHAHKISLDSGLTTVAVMPCGIEVIHPSYQEDLYNRMLRSDSVILSELPGNTPPRKWYYPKRNRIVAGLCKAVLIVEAEPNSGSLITAGLANEYNRKVFAVPGSIFSTQSLGCLGIINSYAEGVYSGERIVKYYYGEAYPSYIVVQESDTQVGISNEKSLKEDIEVQILRLIKSDPVDIDSLASILGVSIARLNTIVVRMCLSGYLQEIGGKYYIC